MPLCLPAKFHGYMMIYSGDRSPNMIKNPNFEFFSAENLHYFRQKSRYSKSKNIGMKLRDSTFLLKHQINNHVHILKDRGRSSLMARLNFLANFYPVGGHLEIFCHSKKRASAQTYTLTCPRVS